MRMAFTSAPPPTQRRLPPRPIDVANLVPNATSPSHVSPRAARHAFVIKRGPPNGLHLPRSTSPRRPMSASRVQPTAASIASALNPSSSSPKGFAKTRPASASRAQVSPFQPLVPVDTISFPLQSAGVSLEDDEDTPTTGAKASPSAASTPRSQRTSAISDLCSQIYREQHTPAAPIDPVEQAKLRAFLESWQDDEPSFRSAILFSESTFAQAKAMVSDWSAPNAFLSAVAYGCLEQFGLFMEKEYPFLRDLITELGAAVYSNFADLLGQQQHSSTPALEARNRFLHYFQHGKHWFQDLAELQRTSETYKFTAATSKVEIQRLNDRLQSHREPKATAEPCEWCGHTELAPKARRSKDFVSDGAPDPSVTRMQFPQLRNLLYGGPDDDDIDKAPIARLDIRASDYEFWPCCEEILLVFQSLPRNEALKLLSSLVERAAELELPGLGEMYAVGVDLLGEKERRQFLREYLLLVSSPELQDALQERDECNDEKRWQLFIDELKSRLGIGDGAENDHDADDLAFGSLVTPHSSHVSAQLKQTLAAKRLARFHSDEAKVGAKVLAMVELLEDLAAETAFLDESQSGFSIDVLERLREFDDAGKRVAKARELMMRAATVRPQPSHQVASLEPKECACHCGNHQLVHKDDVAAPSLEDAVDELEPAASAKTTRRSSLLKRPLSGRRKNAVNFGARLASHRSSTTPLRLFPLAEVCHMLSAILHLKFSRDAADGALVDGGSSSRGRRVSRASIDVVPSLLEDRWSFLRSASKPPTFKTLAKDYLTRKYGIKSIAVMHTLQLERSLVYYSATDKHVRCELFAWFFGADKERLASKDYAFQFFQRLAKSIMSLFLAKRPTASSTTGGLGFGSSLAAQHQQLQLQQPTPLTFAALIAVWTEFIGDGETASSNASSSTNGVLVRYLLPSQAMDACSLAFPARMKEASEYAGLMDKLYQLGLERAQVELEAFLKSVMAVWLAVFDRLALEVNTLVGDEAGDVDFDAFTAAVARSGMELTGGERLEIFDLLSQESDACGVPRAKLLWFFLEAKHLRATS